MITGMTESEMALWNKIHQFKMDDEGAVFKFSQRLSRENGWTINFAQKAIDEYKKFIFLCCISEKGVTPSDQVDQVWHLHLTFTKSYWVDFCRNTIGKEIHHNPTKGGAIEGLKFDDFYSATKNLYKEKFGALPPENLWPANTQRFSDIDFQRVNLRQYRLVRRFRLTKKVIPILVIAALAPLIFIQAFSLEKWTIPILMGVIFLVVMIGKIIQSVRRKNNGKRRNRSKHSHSDSGGIHGCSHHSNLDSGNSHGCSHDSTSDVVSGDDTSSHGSSDSGCSSSGCSSSGCSGCGGGGD